MAKSKKGKYGKNYTYKETAYATDGSARKIGTYLYYEDGTSKTVLNPSGKGAKYAEELRERKHMTNDGEFKTDKSGKVKTLSKESAAFRSGYLQAQKDNANAYKAKRR